MDRVETQRNQLNAMLRDRAFSAGGVEEIPELYGIQQEMRAPGGIDQQLAQQIQPDQQRDPGTFGGEASGIGGAAAPTVGYAPQQQLPQERINQLSAYTQPNYDNGDTGRGDDTQRDTAPSATGPLDDFDEAVMGVLGMAPAPFGLATGFTQAMTALGVPGVNTSQPPPMQDREAFADYMRQVRAAQQVSRDMHDAENFSVGTDVFGDFDAGSFEQGYGQPAAPAPGPSVGGYNVGGYAVGGGLSHGGETGSSFGEPAPSNPDRGFGSGPTGPDGFGGGDGGGGGNDGGGSGGHGGQAGEGAGSGNSAGGGRGDSAGYHDGGIVSDNDGLEGEEIRRDVLEGEGVLTREAVQMLGPDTVLILNELARRRLGSDKSTPNGEAQQ